MSHVTSYYLHRTCKVPVTGTPGVKPISASVPAQAVLGVAPVWFTAGPVADGHRAAVRPDPAALAGLVTPSQPEGVATKLAVDKRPFVLGVHLSEVTSVIQAVRPSIIPIFVTFL